MTDSEFFRQRRDELYQNFTEAKLLLSDDFVFYFFDVLTRGEKNFSESLRICTAAGFDDFRLASITELASLYGQLPGAAGSNKSGNPTPFVNVKFDYWSGSEVGATVARVSNFFNGAQGIDVKCLNSYGWAVRPGDSRVVPVPEPGTAVLLGLGLLGMGVARRWRGR